MAKKPTAAAQKAEEIRQVTRLLRRSMGGKTQKEGAVSLLLARFLTKVRGKPVNLRAAGQYRLLLERLGILLRKGDKLGVAPAKPSRPMKASAKKAPAKKGKRTRDKEAVLPRNMSKKELTAIAASAREFIAFQVQASKRKETIMTEAKRKVDEIDKAEAERHLRVPHQAWAALQQLVD